MDTSAVYSWENLFFSRKSCVFILLNSRVALLFLGKGQNPRVSASEPPAPSALELRAGTLPGPQTPSSCHLPQRASPLRKGKSRRLQSRRLQATASVIPGAAGALILQPNEEAGGQGLGPRSRLLGQLVVRPSVGWRSLPLHGDRFPEAGVGCEDPNPSRSGKISRPAQGHLTLLHADVHCVRFLGGSTGNK